MVDPSTRRVQPIQRMVGQMNDDLALHRRIARQILGMTAAQAQALVDENPPLQIRFNPGPILPVGRPWLITAIVKDGVVVQA